MFDIGFWELCLTAVVALVVIGPERLPKVAYEAGKWFGKLQRFVRNARFELEREMHNYEIQRTLSEQKKELEEIANTAKEVVQQLKLETKDYKDEPSQTSPAEHSAESGRDEK
jgi:sec-independent protein translocase protein TatB